MYPMPAAICSDSLTVRQSISLPKILQMALSSDQSGTLASTRPVVRYTMRLERPGLGHHAGDLVLDEAKLADGPAEGAALLGAVDAQAHELSREPDAARGEAQAPVVEHLHRHLEPLARLAQHVARRAP
jgi:hypothetical protein